MRIVSRPALRAFALAVPAAIAALALTVPAVPAAPVEPPPGANVEVLRIAPNKVTGRFVAPPTVRQGDYLEVISETNPRKVGPHTFSLVTKRSLPKTPKARQACFAPKHICLAIAEWHELNPKTEEVGLDLVDVGAEGWSTVGSTKKKGDSWFTEKLDDSIVQRVTAQPQTLHFICAVHPWMQGKTKVLPAAS